MTEYTDEASDRWANGDKAGCGAYAASGIPEC